MMQAMIQSGVTEQNVAAFKELVLLSERMEDRNAKKQFNAAFVALQAELPAVQAMKAVPNNDGSTRFTYAPYEDIWRQVEPFLKRHGFSVKFSQRIPDEKRITMTCKLMHIGGHTEENEFTVRIGSGPPKSSESQADGAAAQYAQRGALCDCLNIQIRHDTDARAEGGTVTPEQAEELEHRLKMINGDVKAFLNLAGAERFADIHALKYDILDQFLRMRERNKK